jgi:hypothetical protein
MAAKPLPELALWTVHIASGGVVSSNGYIKIASQDTVTFFNGAAFPVNIVFTSNFSQITHLQPGQTSPAIGGSPLNITVDYTIYNANTGQPSGGPYAIEFGTGPLIVHISNLDTSPGAIAIPAGGEIQFNSDATYNVTWKFANGSPANVWSPQPPQIATGVNQVQRALAGANGQSLVYTIAATLLTRGGGTVKVGS